MTVPQYMDSAPAAYDQIHAAIRMPDTSQDEFRVNAQIIAMESISMARYLADLAEPRFHDALEPIRTLSRLGLIEPDALTHWRSETQARFDAALRKLLNRESA